MRWLLRIYRRLARLDQYIQRRFTPVGRLVLGFAVLSGLFALDTRRTQSYQLFALLTALLAVSFVLSMRTGAPVQVRRRLPGIARAFEPFSYSIEVAPSENTETLWLHDRLATRWPGRADLERDRRVRGGRSPWFAYRRWYAVFMQFRGADATDEIVIDTHRDRNAPGSCSLRPRRRGHVHFEQVQIGRTDPLGLCRSVRSQPLGDTVLVLPASLAVTGPATGRGGHHHGTGEAISNAAGQSEEFRGLREYRPGDSLRNIHWKAWARRGEPVVRDFHATAERRQCIVLDHYGTETGEAGFETAVSIAAGIAEWLDADGEPPLLALAGRLVDESGSGDLLGVLRALATVVPAAADEMPALVPALRAGRSRVSALVVVLTAWDAPRQGLVQALRRLDLSVRVVVVEGAGAGEKTPGKPAGWKQAFRWKAGGSEPDRARGRGADRSGGADAVWSLEPGPMADCPERLVQVRPGGLSEGLVLPT